MSLNIIVLAKQVPDTRNVGKDAMKADGTVNRAALPAIYNPEDLNALEQALRIKAKFEGSKVHVLTMGPVRAAEIIRESIPRCRWRLPADEFAARHLSNSYALVVPFVKSVKRSDPFAVARQLMVTRTGRTTGCREIGLPQIIMLKKFFTSPNLK